MKICINGVTRDMTPEEEEEFLSNIGDAEPTTEDKAEAYDILMGGGGIRPFVGGGNADC